MLAFNLDQFVRHLHGEKIPYEETAIYKRYFPFSEQLLHTPEGQLWVNSVKQFQPQFFKYSDPLFGFELYFEKFPIVGYFEKLNAQLDKELQELNIDV
jgi:hypothetical protein